MNKLNVKVQCMATLFMPTGLYAFKRINKLRMGLVIYGAGIAAFAGQLAFLSIFPRTEPELSGVFLILNIMIGIIIPMLCMSNWTTTYNNNIKTNIQSIF